MVQNPITPREIRAQCIKLMPYLTKAFMSMTITATNDPMPEQFLADDQWNIYYNPQQLIQEQEGYRDTLGWSEAVPDEQVRTAMLQDCAFGMCVEVTRLLQRHADRCKPMIPDVDAGQKWVQQLANISSTAVANSLVSKSGVASNCQRVHTSSLPIEQRQNVLPSVEEVLKQLIEQFPPPPSPPSGNQSSQGEGDGEQGQNKGEGSGSGSGQGSGGGSGGQCQPSSQPPNAPPQQSPPPPGSQNPGQQGPAPPSGAKGCGDETRSQLDQDTEPEAVGDGREVFIPRYGRQHADVEWEDMESFTYRHPITMTDNNKGSTFGGSGVDGISRPWETQRKPKGDHTYQYIDSMAHSVAKDILASEKCVPVELKMWADQEVGRVFVSPKDLQSVLQQYTNTVAGPHLRRYNGRNRRQQQLSQANGMQFCLPCDASPQMDIIFVLDISGSMSSRDTRVGLMYIASLLEKMGLSAVSRLYYGDTSPQLALKKVTPEAVRRMRIAGDGGTNMWDCCRKAYHFDKQNGGSPNLIVCVTDGFTPWGPPLPAPLLVVVVPQENMTVEEVVPVLRANSCLPPEWADMSIIDVVAERARQEAAV